MTDNQPPRRTPAAADPPLGTPEGDRAFVRRTALQRNRRIFSIVVGILLVLSFVVFLVTEFMQPHPFNL